MVRDEMKTTKNARYITSGSFREGLQMRGSDIDIMKVIRFIDVCEDTSIHFDYNRICFKMETKDTQPGFAQLRLMPCSFRPTIVDDCEEIGSQYFLSNSSFKQQFANSRFSTVHGPCLTDEDGFLDVVHCLLSKSWITPAKQWITRSNNAWPGYRVKQAIIKHGIIFVPVGVKGSSNEDLEWRISFSVGEKLLIYTFTHTQLLCYVLLKILLKDVIALDLDCNDVICSYFMKTVMFWVSEELSTSKWKAEKLISCFMTCFRRLIYCVKYSVCPHFFIPENNLFANKIKGHAQRLLLNKLNLFNSYGWQCIFFSDQISSFNELAFNISTMPSCLYIHSIREILCSTIAIADILPFTDTLILEKGIHRIMSITNSKIKHLFKFYISKLSSKCVELPPLDDISGNKSTYKKTSTYIRTLLLSTRHDAVCGWLLLASLFYRTKQYYTALYIVEYSLLKYSPEKFHKWTNFSYVHYELFNLHLFRKMPIVQMFRFLLCDEVIFNPNSMLIPDELKDEVKTGGTFIPSVMYALFLRFFCYYRLNDERQCWNFLQNLRLTIEEHFVKASHIWAGIYYNILGICYQLLGDIESARYAFMQSDVNFAHERLSLIS